jgi:diguanylate cyclase (GGDEF)-like protein
MGHSETTLKSLIRLGVLCLALLPAVLFALVSYLEEENLVSNDATFQARRINDFIKVNPESWNFLSERLLDQISSVRHEATSTIIFDKTGKVLAVTGPECGMYCLSASVELNDFGFAVGQIRVSMDIARKLQIAAVIFALCALLGALLLFILDRYVLEPLVITRKANSELQIYDSITRLHNRAYVMKQLDELLQKVRKSQKTGVLMLIDIDRFNVLNDTLGHACGDQLLVELAERLTSSSRKGDLFGRLGGDEFLVALDDLGSELGYASHQAEKIADSIRRKLALPYVLPSHPELLHVTVSIGVTMVSPACASVAELLKQAEIALYEAKNQGRNNIRFFNETAKFALESRMSIEAAMRSGLDNQEFMVFYQPQNDEQGTVIGAEALLRWVSPDQGLISPSQFIGVAEETGLIFPLGALVLRLACEQLKAWENTPWRGMSISVNVSARQFEQEDFDQKVKGILSATGVNPRLLKFEVTESAVIDNLDVVVERMQKLASMGISFSLDDFGTGYSSLHLLKSLPLQQIKIDQMFVGNLTTDPNDYAIVKTIIALGQSLGLDVIAEGVETEEQRLILRSLGCTRYQGYLFGMPKPASEWI